MSEFISTTKKISVLLVDDCAETLDVLGIQLKLLPNIGRVFKATCISEAWKCLQRNSVDLVMVDIHLGKESGFELCSAIGAYFPTLYVVICSIDSDPATKRQAYKIGAMDFIEKPVALAELRRMLKEYEHVAI